MRGVTGGRAFRGPERGQDLLDLVGDARPQPVDLRGYVGRGDMGVVQLLDVFRAERAAAIQPAVNRRAEQPAVTGRKFVPERVAARIGGLAMGGDLRSAAPATAMVSRCLLSGDFMGFCLVDASRPGEGSDPLSPDNVTIVSTRP